MYGRGSHEGGGMRSRRPSALARPPYYIYDFRAQVKVVDNRREGDATLGWTNPTLGVLQLVFSC